jgi:hypothetical protein
MIHPPILPAWRRNPRRCEKNVHARAREQIEPVFCRQRIRIAVLDQVRQRLAGVQRAYCRWTGSAANRR